MKTGATFSFVARVMFVVFIKIGFFTLKAIIIRIKKPWEFSNDIDVHHASIV